VEGLIEGKVRSTEEWLWKKELRFYIGRDNVATVAMVDAQFYYTYEYQGNAPKLVSLKS
jgi:dynein heavy chain 2